MRRLLTTAGVIALVVLGCTDRAAAHAQLESSEPANGAAVAAAPTNLVFVFNQSVTLELGGVSLSDESGATIDIPAASLRSSSVVEVVGLPPLPDGQYVAGYRVVSADGHPISGNIVFRVGSGAVDTDLGAATTTGTVGVVHGAVRFASYPALVVVVGIPLFALLVGQLPRTLLVRAARWGGMAMCAVTLLQFAVTVPYLSGTNLSEALSISGWPALASTSAGAWLIVRFAGAALVAASAWLGVGRPTSVGVQAIGTMAVAVSFVGEGHSATHGAISLVAAGSLVHIAAMALWLAGLGLIARGLQRDDVSLLSAVHRRWTPVAATALALLTLSGVIQAWSVWPSGGSFADRYLVTLLTKIGLVACMAVLGAVGRRLLVRHRGSDTWPTRLRRSVAAELSVGAVVLLLTAILTQTEPGAAVEAAPTSDATAVVIDVPLGDRSITIEVDDTTIGRRSMTVEVDDSARPFQDPVRLEARMTLPEQQLGPIPLLFEPLGGRTWATEQVEIPAPGDWHVEVFVIDPATKARFATTIEFHTEEHLHED